MRIVMKKILVYIPFLVCIGGCIGNKECKEFPQDAVGYMVSSILQTKEISFPSYYIVKDMLGKACRILLAIGIITSVPETLTNCFTVTATGSRLE